VQQKHTEEDTFHCVKDYCKGHFDKEHCSRYDQIRMIEFTHNLARGPNFARHLQEFLLRPEEEFCLDVDAHTEVVQDWDVRLLEMWASVNNEFAILSTTPPDINSLKNDQYKQQKIVPHLCQTAINQRYICLFFTYYEI
jgi:hypothetical protein